MSQRSRGKVPGKRWNARRPAHRCMVRVTSDMMVEEAQLAMGPEEVDVTMGPVEAEFFAQEQPRATGPVMDAEFFEQKVIIDPSAYAPSTALVHARVGVQIAEASRFMRRPKSKTGFGRLRFPSFGEDVRGRVLNGLKSFAIGTTVAPMVVMVFWGLIWMAGGNGFTYDQSNGRVKAVDVHSSAERMVFEHARLSAANKTSTVEVVAAMGPEATPAESEAVTPSPPPEQSSDPIPGDYTLTASVDRLAAAIGLDGFLMNPVERSRFGWGRNSKEAREAWSQLIKEPKVLELIAKGELMDGGVACDGKAQPGKFGWNERCAAHNVNLALGLSPDWTVGPSTVDALHKLAANPR